MSRASDQHLLNSSMELSDETEWNHPRCHGSHMLPGGRGNIVRAIAEGISGKASKSRRLGKIYQITIGCRTSSSRMGQYAVTDTTF